MDPRAQRRANDLEKLKRLRDEHPNLTTHLQVAGEPPNHIKLSLAMRTAGSDVYPNEVQENIGMDIQFPADYPTKPPQVHITTKVWNPNVYTNGDVCIGPIWLPAEGLGLFVIKLIRLLAFDPQIVNPKSPANHAAAAWYERCREKYPRAFPSLDVGELLLKKVEPSKPKIRWSNIK